MCRINAVKATGREKKKHRYYVYGITYVYAIRAVVKGEQRERERKNERSETITIVVAAGRPF